MMNKKLISLALSATLVLGLLAGCSSSTSSSSTATTDNSGSTIEETDVLYQVYHSSPFVTLDPSSEYSNGILVLQNVYETLTYYNAETGELDPKIATDWSSNEDGTVWSFTLRDDVTFHDGTPLTSADVKASIERTISIGQGAAYIWDAVDSIETPSDYEVVINCAYSSPIDLISSAGYAAYIMSDEAIAQDAEWFNAGNDGGSGPYTIAQVEGISTVVLMGYEGYYGGWADDQYKTVLIKEVSESSARRQMLETGEAQISDTFSVTDLEALEANDSLYAYRADTWNNAIAFLNTESAPCDNQDFRLALQYSFPYSETIDGIMDGNATQSYGMVPSGMWGHDETLLQYSTDLDKAQEYIDAAGLTAEEMTVTVTYESGYPEYSSLLQVWQANLKTLGVTMELRGMEWDAQWDEAMATDPDDRQDIFLMRWWPDYASPSSWFDSLMYSEETISFNLSYISNPDWDEMIDEAYYAVATDRDLAESLYIQLQEELLEDGSMVFMFDDSRIYVASDSITGVYENPAYATVIHYYEITKVS